MQYVGLDISKKTCYATVMTKDGKITKQEKFLNSIEELDKFLEMLATNASIVMEASQWEYLYDHIENKGFNVKLADPAKTKAIADAKIKTDKLDSEMLANLLRANLIAESYIPPKHIRELRNLVRHRAYLVRQRVGLKNQVHALLTKEGIDTPFTDLFGSNGMQFLKQLELKESHQFALNNYLELINHYNLLIDKTSKRIESIGKDIPDIQLLTTIPGIGSYSAMLLIAEIGDINRFPSAKKLCSYAGLVPSTHQSGGVEYHGHITKRGSTWMRWVLIQATHIAVRQDNYLQRFYYRIAKRKGGKIAIVATARKMLAVVYHMLKTKKEFNAQGSGTLY